MSACLITIDVGNTATAIGEFPISNTRPLIKPQKVTHISTPVLNSQIKNYLPKNMSGVIVSSVVPKENVKLRKNIQSKFDGAIHFVNYQSPTQLKIRSKKPSEVGADRLVNARAAMEMFKEASIVIDFGTATTFDCVSRNGAYLGGVISPGPLISAEALFERCAQLPFVNFDRPAKILGQTTQECIQSGLYHGYRGMVLEIVKQLKKKLGPKTKIFTTGGQAQWILKGTPLKTHFDPHLTLKGLRLFWLDQAS